MADLPAENPDESGCEDTSAQMNRYINGDVRALEQVMGRHNQRLLRTASRLIRRIRLYDPAYMAEDAVNDT